jgi:hypothetical protein
VKRSLGLLTFSLDPPYEEGVLRAHVVVSDDGELRARPFLDLLESELGL